MTDWRSAYFAQALSDFDMFQRLDGMADVPLCQSLHYLQMSTEKFAKGFLTPPGGGPYEKTHDAFQRFVRVARQRPEVRAACGFTTAAQFTAYVDGLIGKAAEIENLSPEGGDHPNPEYPWQDPRGLIISPLDHPFAEIDARKNLKMRQLVQFIEKCFELAR